MPETSELLGVQDGLGKLLKLTASLEHLEGCHGFLVNLGAGLKELLDLVEHQAFPLCLVTLQLHLRLERQLLEKRCVLGRHFDFVYFLFVLRTLQEFLRVNGVNAYELAEAHEIFGQSLKDLVLEALELLALDADERVHQVKQGR